MRTRNINIRDLYVLLYEDTYYLYGTKSHSCWGLADGFDCDTSCGLEYWEGPFEVFRRPEGFLPIGVTGRRSAIFIKESFI